MDFLSVMFCGVVVYWSSILILCNKNKMTNNSAEPDIFTVISTDITRFENPNDYYAVLDVPRTASQHEIVSAYTKCCQLYNCQTFAAAFNNDKAVLSNLTVLIKYLDTAHATLSNSIKKNYYDTHGTMRAYTDPDTMLNSLINSCVMELDGFVDDFDPNDKSSYWTADELRC
jgi:hypothetical protein